MRAAGGARQRQIRIWTPALAGLLVLALVPSGAEALSPEGDWGSAVLINDRTEGVATGPRLAVDPSGNATAIWNTSDASGRSLWANQFVVGSGWQGPVLVHGPSQGPLDQHEVVADAGGNVTALWVQSDGLMARRYTAASGWAPAAAVVAGSGVLRPAPKAAVDGQGAVTVVWRGESGANTAALWSNRYTPGQGWGAARMVAANNTSSLAAFGLAADAGGNVTAAWYQGFDGDVWGVRYASGQGWGSPAFIGKESPFAFGYNVEVGADNLGNAIAVWDHAVPHGGGYTWYLSAARFSSGGGWGAASVLDTTPALSTAVPSLAVAPDGRAVVAWQQANGAWIGANWYLPAAGWQKTQVVGSGGFNGPLAAIDGTGDAVVVWHDQGHEYHNLWASHYLPGNSTWSPPQLVHSDGAAYLSVWGLAFGGEGRARALWLNYDGTPGIFYHDFGTVWSSEFTFAVPGDVPRDFRAVAGPSLVTLSWSPPGDTGGEPVLSYNLYRGDTPENLSLLESVAPAAANLSTSYAEANASATVPHFYQISTVTATGESTRTPVLAARLATPPSVPRGLKAELAPKRVMLSWDPPADPGGMPVDGYRIYRRTGETAPSLLASTAGLALADSDVEVGQRYYYQVGAVNGAGASERTLEVEAAVGDTPSAPRNLTAARGDGRVTLHWEAPDYDGAYNVSGYLVYTRTNATSRTLAANGSGAPVLTLTGLVNGEEVFVQVSALNLIGEGAATPDVSVTPATNPGPPLAMTAVAAPFQVELRWTAPAANGGAPVTGYRIYRSDPAGPMRLFAEVGNVSLFVDSGVIFGAGYLYHVRAVNAVGEGPPGSNVSAFVPAAGVVETGDNSLPVLPFLVAGAAAFLMAFVLRRRRKWGPGEPP